MHHSVTRKRRGFTLIEAVAALVVLTIAFPPMLWAIRRGHASRVTPAKFCVARWLAASKMEDIIADRAYSGRGYGYLISSNYPAEATVSGYTGYSRSVAFSETAADLTSSGTGYKKVTVTVTFTDGMGTSRSYALSSIQTNY